MAERRSRPSHGGARERWAGVVADLERSGLSVARYSRKHGVSARTLNWWRWALKRPCDVRPVSPERLASRTERTTAGLSFVPVDVLAVPVTAPGDGALHVLLAGGRRIEVKTGFDGATLERLVRLLEAMPC